MSKFAHHLPHLVEVRIGSDAPPDMRRGNVRLTSSLTSEVNPESQVVQEAAIAVLPQLKDLHTLVLKDFGPMEVYSYFADSHLNSISYLATFLILFFLGSESSPEDFLGPETGETRSPLHDKPARWR